MRPIVPPPLQALIAGGCMWGITKLCPLLTFELPAQNWIAASLAGLGIIIELIAVAAFFKAKTTVNPLAPETTNTLVIKGLYQLSRNPMYLGMALLLTGWAFFLGNLVSFAGPVLFILFITELQIKPEEKALTEKFGTSYLEYCHKVRRWI